MWDLGTIVRRNELAAERELFAQGVLAPKRPRQGDRGICAKCARVIEHSVWDGECERCEPQED